MSRLVERKGKGCIRRDRRAVSVALREEHEPAFYDSETTVPDKGPDVREVLPGGDLGGKRYLRARDANVDGLCGGEERADDRVRPVGADEDVAFCCRSVAKVEVNGGWGRGRRGRRRGWW